MEALDTVMPLQLLLATFKNNFFERICFLFSNSSRGLSFMIMIFFFPFGAHSLPSYSVPLCLSCNYYH